MKIAIVGQGYVGRDLAKAALDAGHFVVGIDINPTKFADLTEEFNNPNYLGTSDFSKLSDCEVVITAVPTPLAENKEPDTSFLKAALTEIAKYISKDALVINESTSYPGTLRNLIAAKLPNNSDFAAAPERVDPASPNWNIRNTPRLVSGLAPGATKRAVEFYKTICDKVIEVSTPEVAEAAKLLENTFRQVNIALVNEFAQIAEKFGISAHETISAAGTKPFGFMPFMPGIGVGGHCIPVDPSYLSYAVEELGGTADFIDLANQVNLEMPKYVAERLNKEFDVKNKKIQIAGIAYKPGVSDLRESPALLLIENLRKLGANVIWHDELVGNWSNEKSSPLTGDIDLGLIVTPHDSIDFGPWKEANVRVIDLSATSKQFGWTKYL